MEIITIQPCRRKKKRGSENSLAVCINGYIKNHNDSVKYGLSVIFIIMTLNRLSYVGGLISSIFLLLVALFPDEVKKQIIYICGVSSEVIVFYALIALALFGVGSISVLWLIDVRKKPNVLIQKDSLRFNKYPYFIINSLKMVGTRSNTVYSEITVINHGKINAEKCSVEITLKGKQKYTSKVLSSDSTNALEPNPINISIDAHDGTKGFHPLCLRLLTFDVFLPNRSLGAPGAFDGTLVEHGEYEMFGRVLYDNKDSKIISLGKIKIPDDFLEKAKIPSDIQVILDQGGFIVYLEKVKDKIRAKFYGDTDEHDIMKMSVDYLAKIPQIDDAVDDNGTLRKKGSIMDNA